MDLKDLAAAGKALAEPINKAAINVLDKPTKELGEGIGDLFWMVFSPIHKARMVQELKIKAYVKVIENELDKIPVNKVIEPPLSIVGPALEASKYYIDSDEIRKMFAKLIAASSNSDLTNTVHPSFIEVIKQLSPFDAQILKQLQNSKAVIAKAIAQVPGQLKYVSIYENIIPFEGLEEHNCHLYISSIENLERLSLISINYGATDPTIDTSVLYEVLEEGLHKKYISSGNYPKLENHKIVMKYGVWDFTIFGRMFNECCLHT